MKTSAAIFSAILAAALYALNAPASKLLLQHVSPSMMAALLYLGAGLGMLAMGLIRNAAGNPRQSRSSPARMRPMSSA